MKLLGILNLNQDPASSLMIDGHLVTLVEEERFIRKKHAKGHFPENAIKYCLTNNKLELTDIDYITIGWNIFAYSSRVKNIFDQNTKLYQKDSKSLDWESMQLIKYEPHNFINNLEEELVKCGFDKKDIPPFRFFDHHYSHALTAYIPSKFDEAIIITIDGHGEENSSVVWEARNNTIKKIKEINIPHSLGWFYSAATRFCGFTPNDGEGKTMGLAPYGKPNASLKEKMEKVLYLENYGYKINPNYLFYGKRSYDNEFTDSFVSLFGRPRINNDDIFQGNYTDFAFEAQASLENIVSQLVTESIKKTGIKNICLAGGVALNCKMNGVIASLDEVDYIYVQPISNDVGTTFGSSLALYLEKGYPITRNVMEHVYLGPEFCDKEIEIAIQNKNLLYKYFDNIEEKTASLLEQGEVIGWFQGKMETGPRALGNRSILGDPRNKKMKGIINEKVKFREPWRPFCPSILEEYQDDYIEDSFYHPYMIIAFKVKQEKVKEIPSVVHIDNTARIQSVSKKTNLKYWKLINEFRKLTNVPVLLNTSFNVKGEPIVCTPNDALNTFQKTGMDYLVMGNYLISKE
jgi:carbamoyltransferase